MGITKLALLPVMVLLVVGMVSGTDVAAQEIPQQITRPCKHPCLNKIRFVAGPRLDKLELHARIVPLTSIDPAGESFLVELSNANGTIFTATLNPGDFVTTNGGKRYIYRNPAARTAGGLFRVQIAQRKDANEGYRVDLLAYADLTAATEAEMTTFLVVGDDGFFDTSTWLARNDGWVVDFQP
jgi:hypothetical protein